jgi:hypothetical protein
MNAKELKIEAPEGYEVDWDNSSKDTIRFKKKTEYRTVAEKLFLNKQTYFISVNGAICSCLLKEYPSKANNATSKQQLKQILALNKLMNVAKYLNGDWEPNWNNYNTTKWFIFFDHDKKEIQTRSWYIINPGCVYFKSEELALQAIEILGEEEVKKALGIFE